MYINSINGEITFKNFSIKKEMTLEEFEESDMCKYIHSKSQPGAIFYVLKPEVTEKSEFIIQLSFHPVTQKLILVGLGLSESGRFSTWADWSEEKEIKKDKRHKEFLFNMLGKSTTDDGTFVKYIYPWGMIECGINAKDATSGIFIGYSGHTWEI